MEIFNTTKKFNALRFFTGLIIVGVAFLFVGITFSIFSPVRNYEDAVATVTNVKEIYHKEDRTTEYKILVTYEVDGETYGDIELNRYSPSMTIGKKINIKYKISNPAEIKMRSVNVFEIVFYVLGTATVITGIFMLIYSVNNKNNETEEYNRVRILDATSEELYKIRNDTSPLKNYSFRSFLKGKQVFLMEDENKNLVYEAKMKRRTFFKPYEFEFKNCLTGESKVLSIGHNKAINLGKATGRLFDTVPVSSCFKIDGLNNWIYLGEKGFGFDFILKDYAPFYEVYKYGIKVAEVKTVGADMGGDTDGKDEEPVNGFFSVSCKEHDVENLFLTCFSIARAIFFED